MAAITAIILGVIVGYGIHRASGSLSLQWFFVTASYLLFLMAAGIFSRSIGFLEDNTWFKMIGAIDENDTPPFDPRTNIWYLPYAWEKQHAGYGFLFSLFGYRSVATVGTIVSYISYWTAVIVALVVMKHGLVAKVKNRFK